MTDKRKKVSVDETDYIQELRKLTKEADEGLSDVIDKALDDLAILDGEGQWDKYVASFRKKNGLVTITENLLPSFIDQVEGDFRQNNPQIDCGAVDDKADPETARILAGMIRTINYQSQAEMIYNEAFTQMLSSSFGAWSVHTQYEDEMSFNKEIITAPIENHLAVRWDLTCKKFDTSDKQWATISSVISKRE